MAGNRRLRPEEVADDAAEIEAEDREAEDDQRPGDAVQPVLPGAGRTAVAFHAIILDARAEEGRDGEAEQQRGRRHHRQLVVLVPVVAVADDDDEGDGGGEPGERHESAAEAAGPEQAEEHAGEPDRREVDVPGAIEQAPPEVAVLQQLR